MAKNYKISEIAIRAILNYFDGSVCEYHDSSFDKKTKVLSFKGYYGCTDLDIHLK